MANPRKIAERRNAPKVPLRSSDPSKPMLRNTMSTQNGIPQHWQSSRQRFREGIGC